MANKVSKPTEESGNTDGLKRSIRPKRPHDDMEKEGPAPSAHPVFNSIDPILRQIVLQSSLLPVATVQSHAAKAQMPGKAVSSTENR